MDPKTDKSSIHQQLIDHGLPEQVIEEIENLQKTGLFSDTDPDERACEALKELGATEALSVLSELKQSPNIEHVSNKSALLCSLIKAYRQKVKQGLDVGVAVKRPGPDEVKLKEILDRTKYSLDVTSGQRKYGGPPPNWNEPAPGPGHEIFVGRIPRDMFEDALIPLFEQCGTIWNLRLMIEPSTGYSRGFCFVTFSTKEGAQEAVKKYNGYEISPGKFLKANISVANVRLFVGNIPKNKSRDDILEEFKKHTDGLMDVIIYSSPDDPKKKNRGFAFLEYDSHKSASLAKHKIGNGWMRVWGCDIIVDWADPLEEPDDEIMNKVKVLYVRNLKSNVTDDQLRAAFEQYGKVERVKKVKDYSFVHFEDRNQALQAMQELQGKKIGDSEMQISLAKPPSENKQKEKRRQQFKHFYDDSYIPSPYYGGGSGGGGGPSGMVPLRGMSRSARGPFLFSRGGFRSHIPTVDYYARDYRGGSYTDDYDYYPNYEAEDYLNYAASYPDGRGRALVRGGAGVSGPAAGGITAAVAGGGAGVAAGSAGHVSAPSIRGHLPLWPMYGQPQQAQWPPGRNVPGALQWSPTRR